MHVFIEAHPKPDRVRQRYTGKERDAETGLDYFGGQDGDSLACTLPQAIEKEGLTVSVSAPFDVCPLEVRKPACPLLVQQLT